MRRNKRNGQPYEGVCNVQHTVHSDELFVIRQHKRNGQPDQGVCDVQLMIHKYRGSIVVLSTSKSVKPIHDLLAADPFSEMTQLAMFEFGHCNL